MDPHPPQLDYAHLRPAAGPATGPSATQREVLVAAGCFCISWLAWAVVGAVTYDAGDLAARVTFLMAAPGTLCGCVAFVPVLVFSRRLHDRRERAKAARTTPVSSLCDGPDSALAHRGSRIRTVA